MCTRVRDLTARLRRWLVSHGRAVVARVGSAQSFASLRINTYSVDEADVAAAASGVAHGVQTLFQGRGELYFHEDAVRHPLMMKAGCVDSGLSVHVEAHPVEDGEEHGGDDGGATGRAGDETEFAVAEKDGGGHGAERAVAGSDGVGVGLDEAKEGIGYAGLSGEVVHFVVEKETGAAGD